MRSRLQAFRTRVARRPLPWLAAAAAVIVVSVVAGALFFGNPPRPAGEAIRPTTTERWTLVELATRIEAGEVLTVTVGASDAGGSMLLAQNTMRQYVAITLAGSVGDAAHALVSLGYRDLLSPSALAAAQQASGV